MDIFSDEVLTAFLLTLFAGGATAIGGIIAFFAKHTNTRFLSLSMGFSAGVMVFVSFVEIYPESIHGFESIYGTDLAKWYTTISFFVGIALIAIIDKLIPENENPHEIKDVEQMDGEKIEILKKKQLMRTGLFSAVAIGIHNFPEGVATFSSALINPEVAIPIAVAIAIHNIPEGIAVSVPIYHATGSRRKAFVWSALSGLAEPIGALIAFVALSLITTINEAIMGAIFGGVAGVMVYISLDELLPSAEKYGNHHTSIWGFIFGMVVMALSLLLI